MSDFCHVYVQVNSQGLGPLKETGRREKNYMAWTTAGLLLARGAKSGLEIGGLLLGLYFFYRGFLGVLWEWLDKFLTWRGYPGDPRSYDAAMERARAAEQKCSETGAAFADLVEKVRALGIEVVYTGD